MLVRAHDMSFAIDAMTTRSRKLNRDVEFERMAYDNVKRLSDRRAGSDVKSL